MTFNKLMKTMDNWSEFATDMLANQYRVQKYPITIIEEQRIAYSVQGKRQKEKGKRAQEQKA